MLRLQIRVVSNLSVFLDGPIDKDVMVINPLSVISFANFVNQLGQVVVFIKLGNGGLCGKRWQLS